MIITQLSAPARQYIVDFVRDNRRELVDNLLDIARVTHGEASFSSSMFFATFLDRLIQCIENDDTHPLIAWVQTLAGDSAFDSESSRLVAICCSAVADAVRENTPGFPDLTTYFMLLAVDAETAFLNKRLSRPHLVNSERRSVVSREKTLEAFAGVIRAHDKVLYQHAMSVSSLAGRIATAMALSPEKVTLIRECGLLHDIGKVGIPQVLLYKPAQLEEEEWSVMREHSSIGADIVGAIPELSTHASIIRAHHERIDGHGYPDGLFGAEIPLEAKIVTVADAFHAMISERPYSTPRTVGQAIVELQRCEGTQFERSIVLALTRLIAPSASRLGAVANISSI